MEKPTGRRPRVLLINPRATYAGEIAQKCYPPLNLLYLAGVLRHNGFPVSVLDANAFALPDDEIRAVIRHAQPDLVGIPLYSEILKHVHSLTGIVKEAQPRARVILGGPHAAAVPDDVLETFPAVDYILRNEAEDSLVELCRVLDRAKGERRDDIDVLDRAKEERRDDVDGAEPLLEDLRSIRGLSFRGEGALLHNPDIEERPDIHKIPLPARDLVEEAYRRKRYHVIMVRRRPVDTVITSRGCPHRCGFCYNCNYRYRGRKPDDVIAELVAVRGRGIRNIEIVDDNFTAHRERAMLIFDMIIREKLDVSFRIKSRVTNVDEEFLAKAREAGVYQVSYGMESGVQEILDAMEKGTTVEQNARACELTKRAGMAVHSSWIIGYPGETPETVWRTAEFVSRIRPTTANFGILRPYPQTRVYREAKEAGTLIGDWNPETGEVPWVRLPWTESRADLERLLKKVLKKVYYRPYYAWTFGKDILRNANLHLARYALQEMRKTLLPGR